MLQHFNAIAITINVLQLIIAHATFIMAIIIASIAIIVVAIIINITFIIIVVAIVIVIMCNLLPPAVAFGARIIIVIGGSFARVIAAFIALRLVVVKFVVCIDSSFIIGVAGVVIITPNLLMASDIIINTINIKPAIIALIDSTFINFKQLITLLNNFAIAFIIALLDYFNPTYFFKIYYLIILL